MVDVTVTKAAIIESLQIELAKMFGRDIADLPNIVIPVDLQVVFLKDKKEAMRRLKRIYEEDELLLLGRFDLSM